MREDDHNNFIEMKNAKQIKFLTTYAGKKVTIGAGHFQIIDFFYDW